MKTTLLILIMASSSISLFAQKGSWYIGGVVGYGSTNFKAPSGNKSGSSTWAFGPEGGTFLQDDIQLGLALGISGSNDTSNGNDTETTTTISPTIYTRKFFKLTDNLSTFAGLYLTYLSGKSTDHTVTPALESTQSGINVRLGIGVAYALSPRFTAVGQYGLLGYQSVTSKVAGTETGTDSGFALGVNSVGSSTFPQGNGSGAAFNVGVYYTFKTAQ